VILCDVNVLLNAIVPSLPHHATCRAALEGLRRAPGDMAVSELILAAVVRIGTNPRLFQPAPTADEVFAFVDALRTPTTARVAPGQRHWILFRDLVRGAGIRGADTTDAYLAALAIESRCEWWTTDRGFARFPGLRWRNLAA
jgi:uncharacterized protein